MGLRGLPRRFLEALLYYWYHQRVGCTIGGFGPPVVVGSKDGVEGQVGECSCVSAAQHAEHATNP